MDNAEDDDLGVGMIDAEMSSPIPEDAFSDIVDVDMGDGGHDDATPGDDLAELEETKRTTYFHNITQDGVYHISSSQMLTVIATLMLIYFQRTTMKTTCQL